ncbi:MAG: hypothetical protein KA191_00005 [Verrucomicrobia bacterium]|jgi:hypothetical protein|nr:hypothetical protein [Verrucomicrobiota bacterium]OQC62628.1 MAG: hypothetical protein BWX48_03697 [Verrucomicrobia bacterium ADurb.Bin006]MDI9381142.1 hypothetical protein [Verrucomicrobiota bacterium]HOA62941.1 hypothetical protein [Verrucomicrobiota bacterium]HOF46629.1 hypothetical protein [Verrucomicrobiota bacterium]
MSIKSLTLLSTILLLGCSADGQNHAEADEARTQNTPNAQVEIDNPYALVNWDKAQQIRSTTHIHLTDQAALNRAAKLGYRHLPISNYYPSAPYYPIDTIRAGQFRVKQDFGAVKTVDGQPQYIPGPFYWNDVIMNKTNGWYDKLPEEQRAQLPFQVGDFILKDIPKNIIFSPNAEHHAFANIGPGVHINAPGSLYSSGTFDARNRFRTFWGGGEFSYGAGLPWQESFALMLEQLLFADGGGITINHPHWSGKDLPQSLIEEMLDFDPRVLGIEVLNSDDWDLEMWDRLLCTGRRCLGFFVPDWQVQTDAPHPGGFNVLLVDEFTEHQCLQAYRRGAFFGSQFGGQALTFQRIELRDGKLTIETNSKGDLTVVTDQNRTGTADADRMVYEIPTNTQKIPTIKYVRIEASNGQERIFSQPIRFVRSAK